MAGKKKAVKKKASPKGKALQPHEEIVAALEKKFGKGAVTTLHREKTAVAQIKEFIPLGIDALDRYVIGRGGLPVGRSIEVFGEEGCIVGTARIAYGIIDVTTGKYVNSKGGTLAQLFERFHNIPQKRGAPRAARDSLLFVAPSVNDDGRIVSNTIVDVINSGEKPCYKITCGSRSVMATENHEFLTPTGFVRLEDLAIGDQVMLHLNTPAKSLEGRSAPGRREATFKHHPYGSKKILEGKYTYYRIYKSRAVCEARLNGLTYKEYAQRLNSGKLKGLQFLDPAKFHIHHKDEDPSNDSIENLVIIEPREHNRQHALENHNNLRFAVKAHVIDKIEYVGEFETYDLIMDDPYRNFVVNGFAVHNCGKTLLLYRALAQVQRMGGVAHLLDAEFAFEEERAEVSGINQKKLLLSYPQHLEQCLDMIKASARAHNPKHGPLLIGLDSIASLKTKAGVSLDAGESGYRGEAKLFSDELRDMGRILTAHRACLFMTNQIRHKMNVRFGSNITTPGGNAPKFYCSVRLQFFGGSALKNKDEEHTGKVVTIVAIKNRLQSPFKKAKVRLDYATGYNDMWTTSEHAKRLGIVKARKVDGKAEPLIEQYLDALEELDWPFNPLNSEHERTIAALRGDDSYEADDDDEDTSDEE